MKKNRRILLVSLDLGVTILSFVGILFVSIQPDKGFFLFRYSSFYGIFAIVFSVFSFFYLFFQNSKNSVSDWYIEFEISLLVASLLSTAFSFGFSFPLFSGFDELSFVTSDAVYLSIGAPLLLLAKFAATPKGRKSNIFLFSLASLSVPLLYFVWFFVLQYAVLRMPVSDFPVDVSSYLYPSFISSEPTDVPLILGYAASILVVLYLLGVLLSLFVRRLPTAKSLSVVEPSVEEKKEDETSQGDSATSTSDSAPKDNESMSDLPSAEEMTDAKLGVEENAASDDSGSKTKQGVRVYHVSKQQRSGLWQVKLASSKKAIRLFKTQAEAIKYAKDLSKRNSGSVRIHSVKGTMRKG